MPVLAPISGGLTLVLFEPGGKIRELLEPELQRDFLDAHGGRSKASGTPSPGAGNPQYLCIEASSPEDDVEHRGEDTDGHATEYRGY